MAKMLRGGVDAAYSIQQTTDGGYIVVGITTSNDGDITGYLGGYDYWVVKLDSSGNIQWQKSLGGIYNDEAYSIQQTTDSGYIVVGILNGHYGVIKLDATGNIQWQKSLGGTSGETAYSIIQTNDGGYIVAGQSDSNDGDVSGNHGGGDYWVVKLDSLGNIQWQKCYGGTNTEYAFSIKQTNDGGYIIAGESSSNDGDVIGNVGINYWVVKINVFGILEWQKSLGGIGNIFSYAQSIIQSNDGSYVVAGYTDANNGDVSGNHGGYDMWVVKLGFPLGIKGEKIKEEVSVYPNPAQNIININGAEKSKISIYNLLGEEVMCRDAINHVSTINVSGLSEGSYIIKIISAKKVVVKQLIIEN